MKQKIIWMMLIVTVLWLYNADVKAKAITLTDEQIEEKWGGIDEAYLPQEVIENLEKIFPKEYFNEFFPNCNGPQCSNNYYSYENFKEAIAEMSKIKYKIVYRQDRLSCYQIYRLDKISKEQVLICQSSSFDSKWLKDVPTEQKIVDMGTFLMKGTKQERQRELAAFLACIVGETEGNPSYCLGGDECLGLYFNEEIKYQNSKSSPYSVSNELYPPISGKSYHGRGPMQITWNYNYGLISGIIYGDKNILLDHPEYVEEDGKLGFMTAITFWMIPQGKKPSCHLVMTNQWQPSQSDIASGRTQPGFGIVVLIVRGNAASNKLINDFSIFSRTAHYQYYAKKWGIDVSNEKIDTYGMYAFK